MLSKLRSLYTDPLYRNSLAIMLNSAIGTFFDLLFWIVAARTMPAKEIGLATAAISAAALIVGLSKLGLDAGLVRYLPESKNKNGLYSTIVMVTLVPACVLFIYRCYFYLFCPEPGIHIDQACGFEFDTEPFVWNQYRSWSLDRREGRVREVFMAEDSIY